MSRNYGSANQIDLGDMVPCPTCNKDIVPGAWHPCKRMLQGRDYVNTTLGIHLHWSLDSGWRSYDYLEGDVIEDLTFAQVFNLVTQDSNYVAVDLTGD